MYKQNQALVKLLQPVISGLGYEMLGIESVPQGRDSLVRIYIDREGGISLDDCERVSEQVTGVLDVEDPVKGSYRLEVSSPGLDRPLFTLEQCRRYLGCDIHVRLRSKLHGRRKITGRLTELQGETIVIDESGTNYDIPADMIERASLVPEL
ncbi:MAG: ribosome maturation factor RimP [Gammaproteobacteria bacterium]